MRIAAIDAGLESTGVAVLDTVKNDFLLIEKIRTSIKKATPTNQHRAAFLVGELSQILFETCPDYIVTEDIFINPRRPSAIIPVARLRGHIESMVIDLEYKDGLYVMPTKTLKKVITGNGNGTKERCFYELIQAYKHSKLVKTKLGRTFIDKGVDKNDDMSDACCIAHAFKLDSAAATIM